MLNPPLNMHRANDDTSHMSMSHVILAWLAPKARPLAWMKGIEPAREPPLWHHHHLVALAVRPGT